MDDLKKIEMQDIRTLANERLKKSETKPELKRVDVPDKPQLNVTVTQWEKMWAVFDGWLNTKVKDAAEGKRVELPDFGALARHLFGGVKWVLVSGVVVALIVAVLKVLGD